MFDGQVNGDDAVFDFAASAAVLPLHAGGFVPLLGHAGLVDEADDAQFVGGLFTRSRQVLGDDAALSLLEQSLLIPTMMGEKLLKRTNCGTAGERDRLDALSGQVTEQSPAVGSKVPERRQAGKAFAKAAQELRQSRPQAGDLIFGHRPPCLLEVLPRPNGPR